MIFHQIWNFLGIHWLKMLIYYIFTMAVKCLILQETP